MAPVDDNILSIVRSADQQENLDSVSNTQNARTVRKSTANRASVSAGLWMLYVLFYFNLRYDFVEFLENVVSDQHQIQRSKLLDFLHLYVLQ
jgi:hypothetical protein